MWISRLSPEQAGQVRALADRAEVADGTAALNEEARFAWGDDSARHFLARAGDELVGYLQWQPGYASAQLVVDPGHRREGIGRGLVAELERAVRTAAPAAGTPSAPATEPPWGLWAFGDRPAARGFAAALGLRPSRGLLMMARDLDHVEDPPLPEGFTLRGFTPADTEPFLAVNAAAFAHHPEQGALDAAGFAARAAESWFDPRGLILGVDATGLAGFHWTKLVDRVGEVYVLGVAPRAQGHGYGKLLLQAGLAHLSRAGAPRVVLYVDSAEPVALRTYESAGFRVVHRDVFYVTEPVFAQMEEQKEP